MDAKTVAELLRFAGQHQFLTIALVAMVCVVALNVVAYGRGKMSLTSLHKRPHEYIGYVAAGGTLLSFVNHFLDASCK